MNDRSFQMELDHQEERTEWEDYLRCDLTTPVAAKRGEAF